MVTYILGGGVSGLNTARELAKRNQSVVLFEAEEQVGGLAGFIELFGRNLDLGPHIFHTPDEEIKSYLLNEFPGCFFERKHWAANFKNNRFYDYPISKEFIESLPAETSQKVYDELSQDKSDEANRALTYDKYIEAIAGPTLRELFFTKYPQKVWGRPTQELDANWAPKRVEIREKRQPFFGSQWSAVGIDGTATIINELERQCRELGVEIHTSARVTDLGSVGDRITSIHIDSREFIVNTGDIVINTLPLDVTLGLTDELCDVEYRGVMLAFVHTENVTPFPDGIDFIYVDDLAISFNRVSDQNTFVAVPDEYSTVLCCEITYSAGDSLDCVKKEELLERVKDDLVSLGILGSHEILDVELIKLPRVYPMFSLGYRDKMNRALGQLGKLSNIQTIGSLAEFAYSDLQILFAKSRDLAERLCAKTPQVNSLGHNKPTFMFNDSFKMLGAEIGLSNPAFLIAEIGLNHNGSIEIGKQLIDMAYEAGFNAVKFQTFNSEGRSAESGKTAKYSEKVIGTEETDYEMFRRCELSVDEHKELFAHARRLGVAVFSAPFDEDSADLLEELSVDAYKIASMELTNLRLVKHVAEKNRPIILSTGMATLSEIEEALATIAQVGNRNVAVLHCTSIYPAPAEAINLRAIQTMEFAFKVPIGFSDHFSSEVMSIASIAMGAKIIEKHVTLDRRMEGPDHALSIDPVEQRRFVSSIRQLENGMGTGVKRPHREEAKSEVRFRKSMHFKSAISKGTKITSSDIILKAPCYGMLPKYENIIIGLTLTSDVTENQPITWDLFE